MKNQLEFIVNELKTKGRISRNYCLKNYISRLGAYICKLEKFGWEFATKSENGDYVYFVVRTPLSSTKSNYTAPAVKTAHNSNLGVKSGNGGLTVGSQIGMFGNIPKRWIE